MPAPAYPTTTNASPAPDPSIVRGENPSAIAADGFLIVYRKDQQFELDQVEIDKDDFRNWYVSHADTLLNESV